MLNSEKMTFWDSLSLFTFKGISENIIVTIIFIFPFSVALIRLIFSFTSLHLFRVQLVLEIWWCQIYILKSSNWLHLWIFQLYCYQFLYWYFHSFTSFSTTSIYVLCVFILRFNWIRVSFRVWSILFISTSIPCH